MAERLAIRNKKKGLAHTFAFGVGDPSYPWVSTLCGRTLGSPERIPWEQTAPEDRCRTCARRVAAEEEKNHA